MRCKTIQAALDRGGTSRGLFLLEESINRFTGKQRDELIFKIMGRGTIKSCVDGLGGEASSVNKIAILQQTSHSSIHYTLGQITENAIDWNGTCGNLSSTIPLAFQHLANRQLDSSIIDITTPAPYHQKLRIHHDASSENDLCDVQQTTVEFIVDNEFSSCCHTTSELLDYPVTITTAIPSNPTVFVDSAGIDMNDNVLLQNMIENIRNKTAEYLGIALNPNMRVSFVSKSLDNCEGNAIQSVISAPPNRMHHAHTITGGINLCVACCVENTIPNQMCQILKDDSLIIKHPAGNLKANISVENNSVSIDRTARLLMIGQVPI